MPADITIDLITRDTFLEYAGRQPDSKLTNEARLDMLVTSCSQLFTELAGGRKFLEASDLQHFDGKKQQRIFVRYPPINSSPAIILEYWNITAWKTADATTYAREQENAIGLIRLTSSVFHPVRWRVTYTGGYILASIPFDIKQAVCQLVDRAEQRAAGKEGVRSDSKSNQSVQFDLGEVATETIKRVAAKYKVVHIT